MRRRGKGTMRGRRRGRGSIKYKTPDSIFDYTKQYVVGEIVIRGSLMFICTTAGTWETGFFVLQSASSQLPDPQKFYVSKVSMETPVTGKRSIILDGEF